MRIGFCLLEENTFKTIRRVYRTLLYTVLLSSCFILLRANGGALKFYGSPYIALNLFLYIIAFVVL